MNPTTVSALRTYRAFNFNAGPGHRRCRCSKGSGGTPGLRRAGASVGDGDEPQVGLSSKRLMTRPSRRLRRGISGVSDDYAIVFFALRRQPAVFDGADEPLRAGQAGGRAAHRILEREAISELKKGTLHRIAATTEPEKFVRVPKQGEIARRERVVCLHVQYD